MSDALALLEAGRMLLEDKDSWTKNRAARTRDGSQCNPESDSATSWCSVGALLAFNPTYEEEKHAEHYLRVHTFGAVLTEANDKSTHEEVLAWWDKAIESAAYEAGQS